MCACSLFGGSKFLPLKTITELLDSHEGSGKKSTPTGRTNQAQDVVDILLWKCKQNFHSPAGILLDKPKELDPNQIEGCSFF